MAFLDLPWFALFIVAVIVAFFVASFLLLKAWAHRGYAYLWQHPKTSLDIDSFVKNKHPPKRLKVFLLHRFRLGYRQASLDAIPLECIESPHVPGLQVSRRASKISNHDNNIEEQPNAAAISMEDLFSNNISTKTPIVIATIRMGFGHHRLAYSACSWALATGHPTIFHDLLNIESDESKLIKSTDELYSKFSRYASEIGGPVEKLWGSLMLSGDADALRIAALTANHLLPLLLSLPKNAPIITTHQLVALTAAAAGFTNVVNLVVDNHPQWFLVVPNTLNLVQGPVNYQSFLRLGVPPDQLQFAGHWCPKQLVENIEQDCKRRMNNSNPCRILIPVGGAGAQRKFILSFISKLAPKIRDNQIQLFLNAGDHGHMKTAFQNVLAENNLDYDIVDSIQGVREFAEKLLNGDQEPAKAITLFAFQEYFPAVATTDILCRVSDVLACKPSELAFYPIPKLHIRRVGDHEAHSATRAAELGDGTVEAREVEDAMEYIDLFLQGPELLAQMNRSIIHNAKMGLYDGCKKAVELSLERTGEGKASSENAAAALA